MPWTRNAQGQIVWQNDDGTTQDYRPVSPLWAPYNPEAPNAYNYFGRFMIDPANVGDGETPYPAVRDTFQNMGRGLENFFTRPSGPRDGAAPAPAGAPEQAPTGGSFSPFDSLIGEMPRYGGGGGLPARIAAPPALQLEADPSLRSREQHARDRRARLEPYFADLMEEIRGDGSPQDRPWWQRLAGAMGAAANVRDASELGTAVGGYWEAEEAQARQWRADMIRAALAQEGLTDAEMEALFARESGEYQTDVGNRARSYEREVGEVAGQNQWNLSDADLASRQAGQRLQSELLAWNAQNERMQQALTMIARNPGAAGFEANRRMFAGLPADIQASYGESLAQGTLQSTIEREIQLAGNNAGRQRRSVHSRMEEIAGREIPEPPRPRGGRALDTQALTRYYAQYVDLTSPALASAYPGFSPVE